MNDFEKYVTSRIEDLESAEDIVEVTKDPFLVEDYLDLLDNPSSETVNAVYEAASEMFEALTAALRFHDDDYDVARKIKKYLGVEA